MLMTKTTTMVYIYSYFLNVTNVRVLETCIFRMMQMTLMPMKGNTPQWMAESLLTIAQMNTSLSMTGT